MSLQSRIAKSNSRARVGLVLVMLIVGSLWHEEFTFVLHFVTAACAVWAGHEMCRIFQKKGTRVVRSIALAGCLGFVAISSLGIPVFPERAMALCVALPLITLAYHSLIKGSPATLAVVPMTVFVCLYAGLPMALSLQILQASKLMLFYTLLVVWFTDTFAYLAGRMWGRTLLAPELSPKKTSEGALGGLIGAIVAGAGLWLIAPAGTLPLGLTESIVLAVIVSVTSQMGDLAESALKRDAGVKDSGSAFLGHGGVLDRIDSLLFGFTVVYLYMLFADLIVH